MERNPRCLLGVSRLVVIATSITHIKSKLLISARTSRGPSRLIYELHFISQRQARGYLPLPKREGP